MSFGRASSALLLVVLAIRLQAATGAAFAGSAACNACHRQEVMHYAASGMHNALQTVESCDILRTHPRLTFNEGGYSYEITRQGDQSVYTVANGKDVLTVPLRWAFGLGQAGQTYVFERNGFWHESRVSFFNAVGGLDLTMGAQGHHPRNLEEAAGRVMDGKDSRECFGCHATGVDQTSKLQLERVVPGVQCENCHGPAAAHVEAFRSGLAKQAAMRKLGEMPAEEMSDLCGACHRTWAYVATNGPHSIGNVRFQPYRLTNSKCYDAADARIRCTACHDPHRTVVRAANAYDAACAACHSPGAKLASAAAPKLCPVGKQNCPSCHMPKYDLPGAHAKFTDHQIRIVRANAPYPN